MISSNTPFFASGQSGQSPLSNRIATASHTSIVSEQVNSSNTAPQNSAAVPTAVDSQKPASAVARRQATPEGQASADVRSEKEAAKQAQEAQQLLEDQRKIAELSARDREVRAHEQAHAAVGGSYAGAPKYQTERGPDGVNYAVGGEVPIDVGKAATPQETILKAQIVRRAALAPAEPSPQDRKVAAQANQLETQARNELRSEQAEKSELTSQAESQAQPGEGAQTEGLAPGAEASTSRSVDGDVNESAAGQTRDAISPAFAARAAQFSLIASIETPRSGSLLSQIA